MPPARDIEGCDRDFCRWAGACPGCHPEQRRDFSFHPKALRDHGSYSGASYERARKGLREMAARLRELADELDQAHADGFRLYDVSDYNTVSAAKGRVKTRMTPPPPARPRHDDRAALRRHVTDELATTPHDPREDPSDCHHGCNGDCLTAEYPSEHCDFTCHAEKD